VTHLSVGEMHTMLEISNICFSKIDCISSFASPK
jgi:hypothetical protein